MNIPSDRINFKDAGEDASESFLVASDRLLLSSDSISVKSGEVHAKGMLAGRSISRKLQRLVRAAKFLKEAVQLASNHGTRLANAGASVAVGVAYLGGGDWKTRGLGAFMAAAGVKDIWNMLMTLNSDTDLSHLLSDANAGIDMIETLTEANGIIFESVRDDINAISDQITLMDSRMDEMGIILTEGVQEVEALKDEACELHAEATALYYKAVRKYTKGQYQLAEAENEFKRVGSKLNNLIAFAKENEIEEGKIEKFVKDLENIRKTCERALILMQSGQEYILKGTTLSRDAEVKKEASYAKFIEASTTLKNNFSHLQMKLEEEKKFLGVIEVCKDKIEAGIGSLEETNQAVSQMTNDVRNTVNQIGELAASRFEPAGATLGFAAASLVGGVPGILAGLAAAGAYHYRRTLCATIDRVVHGPMNFVPVETDNDKFAYLVFNKQSTGVFNRIAQIQTRSYTEGMIEVQIGNEAEIYPFNLNNAAFPISVDSLKKMQATMLKRIEEGNITPQQCMDIIRELETKVVKRGGQHFPVIGLIATNSPYFVQIRLKCKTSAEKTAYEIEYTDSDPGDYDIVFDMSDSDLDDYVIVSRKGEQKKKNVRKSSRLAKQGRIRVKPGKVKFGEVKGDK